MSLSLYKLHKWAGMLTGKNVEYVNQGVGRRYSTNVMAGYYNDLTEKVTRGAELSPGEVPRVPNSLGEIVFFPIAICQYGLGAYDLYLEGSGDAMLKRALTCADWLVDNQFPDGSWDAFSTDHPDAPFSSMAQGEGVSLLLRAHKATGFARYVESARSALAFMLKPRDEGGVSEYATDGLVLYEFGTLPPVLNGWIFSAWGLYDAWLYLREEEAKSHFESAIKAIASRLPYYDNGYWSRYAEGERIASPFYHGLHIAQLNVLFDQTGIEIFKAYAERFDDYRSSRLNSAKAFCVKAWQKVLER